MMDYREHIEDILSGLPEKPGVYIMKDGDGEIIYIGKARLLKNRVRQYFRSSKRRNAGRYPYHDHELFRTGRLPHQLFHMDYPLQGTSLCKQKPSTSTGNREITRLDVKPGSTSIDYKSSLLSPSPISRG